MADTLKTGYVSDTGNIVTPEFRVNWANVISPGKPQEGKDPEYSIEMLFLDDSDLSILKKAAADALREKFGSKMDDPNFVKTLRSPFRDQGEKDQEGYVSGRKFITSKAKLAFKPGLVDRNSNDIIEPHQFYNGCYAVAAVAPYAYDNKSKGVAFGLRHVMKTRDAGENDPPLGGATRTRPTDEFKPMGDITATAGGAASLFD